MKNEVEAFLTSIDITVSVFEYLHTGIALFNSEAKLMFANTAYKKMYELPDDCIGLDAASFFITAQQGIYEVLKTKEPNSCASVSVTGLYGVTYRWPLLGRHGEILGCITENISVSSKKSKISEIKDIMTDLESYSKFSTSLYPRHNTKGITFDSVVGESPSMQLVKSKGKRFAQHDEPILILGENGTGKDLIAQAIHAASARSSKNFVTVNCSAIPHELIESELFGYASGAFTGAKACGKKGLFEEAEGGTIFLDEIGEMPLMLQAKLLRVLENHEIQKIGCPNSIHVDFRLLSATNRNLEQMVTQGLFREDLYYRLNLFDLVVPPLRERILDIPLLSYSIIAKLVDSETPHNIRLEKEVLSVFAIHPWRGNVRELRNVLTYALYSMQKSETILSLHHLPERFFHKVDNDFLQNTVLPKEDVSQTPNIHEANAKSIWGSRNNAERGVILDALEKSGGNKSKAAKMLGIARSNLYKKITLLGIE